MWSFITSIWPAPTLFRPVCWLWRFISARHFHSRTFKSGRRRGFLLLSLCATAGETGERRDSQKKCIRNPRNRPPRNPPFLPQKARGDPPVHLPTKQHLPETPPPPINTFNSRLPP